MFRLSSLLGGYGQDERRFLIPQVLQSSMMDCGPAALKAILGGFGIHVSYGRLREACQTDVDGTSIDTLEDLAVRLGLDAIQIILPADHLFLPEAEALPALAVMLQPNGLTHFVVIWRRHGPWVQIMDPGTGRHWMRIDTVKEHFYIHQHAQNAVDWQEWAVGPEFCDPLLARMVSLCYDSAWSEARLQEVLNKEGGQGLAVLDAATRMTASLVKAGGINKGTEAGELIQQLLGQPEHIPQGYWSAFLSPENSEQVILQGAILLHIAGLVEESNEEIRFAEEPSESRESTSPEQQIVQTLCLEGVFTPLLIISGVLLAGLGTALEVVVLRGMVEIGQQLPLAGQRAEAFMMVILFLLSLLILEWPLHSVSLRLGRRFELRLRQRFLEKIPGLGDRYFHSRLTSDMIQRAYELRHLRIIPVMGMQCLKILTEIICITAGLIILYPQGSPLILFSCLSIIAISLVTQPLVQEQDMRFRTHIGGLSRFYLDALQGLLPIRSHGAIPALRSEHERLLVDWAKAGLDFFVTYERMTALNLLFSSGLAILLLYSYMQSGSDNSGTFILLYWMLTLPQLGRSLAELTQLYPSLRNRLLRLMDPLNAPDESYDWYQEEQTSSVFSRVSSKISPENVPPSSSSSCSEGCEEQEQEQERGLSIHLENVRVVLSGKTILNGLNAQLSSGEQVAVVGPSGAGKSTLIGLLLGWYRPASGGTVRVNGELLQGERLQQLRREMVWVDPEVQLWNRSLRDNLNYGNETVSPPTVELLSQADLLDVLSRLPDGEDTLLGENGGFLSGGEGQRVRLGRGLNRDTPRLVILDEPFRGLTREQRRDLLAQARRYWQGATLIFISHDVSDSLGFDRVWMMKDGELVEDDQPQRLAACSQSAYAQLLEREKTVRALIWNSADWIRLRLEKGKLVPGENKIDTQVDTQTDTQTDPSDPAP